jgi:hypothetical protein
VITVDGGRMALNYTVEIPSKPNAIW